MGSGYEEKLPVEMYDHARKTLGETKEHREQCLNEITKWLDENLHINADRDIISLLHFLRGSKFRIDKTKKKIEYFYKMRSERIEWFTNRNPFDPEIQELLDIGVFLPLKDKDPNGCQLFIIRTGAHSAKKHQQNDVLKVCKMVLDLALYLDESVSIYGAIAIVDMDNVSWAHGLQMTPMIIKRAVHSWENYSCRNKRMEFINSPNRVNIILNTFRYFMSPKMKERLYVTKGLSTISPNHLPSNIGGNGPSYKELAAYWKAKTEQHADWFAQQEQYKMTY